jgi:hypothetical protein
LGVSRWQQTALIGIAKLTGSAALGATPGALLVASVPDVIKVLFERDDEARRRRARDFAAHVASVMELALQERIDLATAASARLAASTALARNGLTDSAFIAIDLDPHRAARAVLENVGFSADERIEIAPLAERVLVAFYDGIAKNQATFAEFMPAIHMALLRRTARMGEDVARIMALLDRPQGNWIEELREILAPSVPNLEFIADERLPAVVRKLLEELQKRPELALEASASVQALLAEVEERLQRLDFGAAASRLDQALAERKDERERRAIDDAALLEERARVSTMQLRYREAAAFLGEAAQLVAFDPERCWRLTLLRGLRLYDLGHEFGDNDGLREATATYRAALLLVPRHRAPLDWARTQSDLGGALFRLGERGDDAALREATSAYRLALEEQTRERVPLDWAMSQNDLGNALLTLGARGDDDAMRNAIAVYREALKERGRELVPLDWAMTMNNLATALFRLGERGDNAALHEAVAAYRFALDEYTRERVPLEWAAIQNNLGNALSTLGERGDDVALRESVAAYRAALEERTRERVPLGWATTQSNLGGVLLTLGERGDDDALREAISACRAALTQRTRASVPIQWAFTQENLALALRAQAERTRDCALTAEALTAIDGAIEEFAKRDAPHYLAKAQQNRERILATARELGCP